MRKYLHVLLASLFVFVLPGISYGKRHAGHVSTSDVVEKTATNQVLRADGDADTLDATEGQLKKIIAMCKRKKMLDDDQAAYLVSGAGRHEYAFKNTGCRIVVNTTKDISSKAVSNTFNHAINTLGYMAQSPAGSVAGDCFRSVFKEQKTLYMVILPKTAGFAGAYIGNNSILLGQRFTGPDKLAVPHEIAHVIYGHGITKEAKQKVIAEQEAMGYSTYKFEFFPMISTDFILRSDRNTTELKTTRGKKFGKEYTRDLVDLLVALYGTKKCTR